MPKLKDLKKIGRKLMNYNECKMTIVVRKDLKMDPGKAISQGCHAALESYKKAVVLRPECVRTWTYGGVTKIVLGVRGESALKLIFEKALAQNLPAAMIHDAGHTAVPAGTATAVGIGPAPVGEIDLVTGKLQLY